MLWISKRLVARFVFEPTNSLYIFHNALQSCARIQVITLLRAARALCPNLINILPDTPEGLYPPPPTGCFATCLRSAPKNPFSVLPPAPLSRSLFINPAASARGLQSRLPLSLSLSLFNYVFINWNIHGVLTFLSTKHEKTATK